MIFLSQIFRKKYSISDFQDLQRVEKEGKLPGLQKLIEYSPRKEKNRALVINP
jgi:hypothetical protein